MGCADFLVPLDSEWSFPGGNGETDLELSRAWMQVTHGERGRKTCKQRGSYRACASAHKGRGKCGEQGARPSPGREPRGTEPPPPPTTTTGACDSHDRACQSHHSQRAAQERKSMRGAGLGYFKSFQDPAASGKTKSSSWYSRLKRAVRGPRPSCSSSRGLPCSTEQGDWGPQTPEPFVHKQLLRGEPDALGNSYLLQGAACRPCCGGTL